MCTSGHKGRFHCTNNCCKISVQVLHVYKIIAKLYILQTQNVNHHQPRRQNRVGVIIET